MIKLQLLHCSPISYLYINIKDLMLNGTRTVTTMAESETKLTRVKLDAIFSVVACEPVEPGKVIELSFIDEAVANHDVRIVVYYRSDQFSEGPMASSLENLRFSLSNLLDSDPKVTGRLGRGSDGNRWEIKCNDAGVRVFLASVDVSLDEWLGSADAEEEKGLTAWEEIPVDTRFWPPFRIQINSFKCGGLALGVSCTHMIADITSIALFINSWAQVHSSRTLSNNPTFNLPAKPLAFSPTKLNPACYVLKSSTVDPSPKLASATIRISSSVIERRLSELQPKCPNATPFDFLLALLWSRITVLQQPSNTDQNPSLCICLDSRNQWIHYGYSGNALFPSVLDVDADKLLNNEPGHVAHLIHQHVESLKEDDFWSAMKWLEEQNKVGGEHILVYGHRLTCINMENVIENGQASMYTAEFKSGEKPVHVSYQIGKVAAKGLIIVAPSPEGGLGRTMTVTLPEEQIEKLCKDEAVLCLEPTVLLTGRR